MVKKLTNISKYTLPIYWAFLTYMLLRPGSQSAGFFATIPNIDKLVHTIIFALLGLLLKATWPQLKATYYFQIIFAYALLTEILQDIMPFGRSLEVLDILADMLGALIAYYTYKELQKKF